MGAGKIATSEKKNAVNYVSQFSLEEKNKKVCRDSSSPVNALSRFALCNFCEIISDGYITLRNHRASSYRPLPIVKYDMVPCDGVDIRCAVLFSRVRLQIIF